MKIEHARTKRRGRETKSNCAFITGYERDAETDLDFAQARYYSKNLGRFTSADEPFADQSEDDPQSWSLYNYVRNNPLNLVDPLGMAAGCPAGSPPGCFVKGGKYYIKDEDGEEREYDPTPIEVKTREKGPDQRLLSFFRGFRRVAEPALPILEAITPGAGVGGGVIKGGIWAYRGGKWLFNAFRAGNKVRQTLPIPKVTNSKLANLVKDLYKGARAKNPVGTGSTADAVRSELQTGLPTAGKFHSQKAKQYSRALEKWLQKNTGADHRDRMVAQSILNDLKGALGGN